MLSTTQDSCVLILDICQSICHEVLDSFRRLVPSLTHSLFRPYYYERNPHSVARRIHRRHFNYDIVFSRKQLKRFLRSKVTHSNSVANVFYFQTDSNKHLFWEQNATDAPTKTWNSKCAIPIYEIPAANSINSMKKIARTADCSNVVNEIYCHVSFPIIVINWHPVFINYTFCRMQFKLISNVELEYRMRLILF